MSLLIQQLTKSLQIVLKIMGSDNLLNEYAYAVIKNSYKDHEPMRKGL